MEERDLCNINVSHNRKVVFTACALSQIDANCSCLSLLKYPGLIH